MTSPRLLFNCMLIITVVLLAKVYIWITSQFSLGFEVIEDPNTHQIVISQVSPELERQGLKLGSEIISIGNSEKTIKLNVTHFSTTPVQRKSLYQNKVQYFSAQDDLHSVFSHPVIRLTFADQSVVDVKLSGSKSLEDIPRITWIRLFLGLVSALMGIMVWVWRPFGKETIYYALSGVGLSFAIIPSAIDSVPMLVRSYSDMVLLDGLTAVGNYMYLTFGAVALLYFPQQLPHANIIAKRIFIVAVSFSLYAVFNTWGFNTDFTKQRLYFSDFEIYGPIFLSFILVILFCYQQWRFSHNKPVERARSSWVILSWLMGPTAYMLFYYFPTVSGMEPLMNRTLAWVAICSSYWMILFGLSRFKLFDLEHHINHVWEWFALFLVFLLLDMAFASLTTFTPYLSTFVILCLVLFVYMPGREWLYSRIRRKKVIDKNNLFSDAVATLLASKQDDPKSTWNDILQQVFVPGTIEWRNGFSATALEHRGQGLMVAGNRFSPPIYLEYAEKGERLFGAGDVEMVTTMSALFEQLYDFHLAFLAGQNQERERIRRDLHDQIGHKLLSLIYASDDTKVKTLAQDTLEQLRGLITALRFEPVPLQSTVMEIRTVAEEACENFDLQLHWDNQITAVNTVVGSYQYLNVINIARELLNNIIRHANASEVSFISRVNATSLIIEVKDNGVGLNRDAVVMGNGLYNIDARARELNATIDWHNDAGCHVVITVPLTTSNE
jgi:signal transduction histidine kinase